LGAGPPGAIQPLIGAAWRPGAIPVESAICSLRIRIRGAEKRQAALFMVRAARKTKRGIPLAGVSCHIPAMRFHASCAARRVPGADFAGVLLCGPAGGGKSDLLLRLLRHGFGLVADDQVLVVDGVATAPAALAGMLEVRGLGIFRLPFIAAAPLRLVVRLGVNTARLPEPELDAVLGLPVVTIDPAAASAPERVALALDAACGLAVPVVGAFAV